MTAIKASLHSYKSLATRKQLQITLEVPKEYAAEALKMMGVADPSGTEWFAIARLQENGPVAQLDEQRNSTATDAGSSPAGPTTEKPRTHFRDKPRAEQAGMMIKDEAFGIWIAEKYPSIFDSYYYGGNLTPDAADMTIKLVLGITSKKELDTDEAAGKRWDALYTDYSYRDQVHT